MATLLRADHRRPRLALMSGAHPALGLLLLCALVIVVGCGRSKQRKLRCNADDLRARCSSDENGAACRAITVANAKELAPHLDAILDGEAEGVDELLRKLFALGAEVTLTDAEPLLESGVVFSYAGVKPVALSVPIDWSLDPDGDPTFRFRFHSLGWLSGFGEGEDPLHSLETGAAVLLSYERDVMQSKRPFEMTWHDHAMALRLEHVGGFAVRYIAGQKSLSRAVLMSAARIVVSHLAALSSPLCYRSMHNHGAAQDVAILRTVKRFSALADSDSLQELATKRLLEQMQASVSKRGSHLENSPGYQLYATELVTQAAHALGDSDGAATRALVAVRDRMLEAMVHLLQSNMTFPQFGDTNNRNRRRQLARLFDWMEDEERTSPSADQLRWVAHGGRKGSAPTELDRLFPDAGFYATRDRWGPGGISVHMTCGFPSNVHYQPDEGSFEVMAQGRELIVDSGIFRHGVGRFADFQDHPRGQNVLVVNDASYVPKTKPRLTQLESSPARSVAQCAHESYVGEGIKKQTRTWTFERAGRLAIVDVGQASRPASLVQLVMLHPELSEVEVTDDGAVTARFPDGSGPSLTIRARERRANVTIRRGIEAADRPVAGWWFAGVNKRQPTAQIAFDYGNVEGAFELALDVVISTETQ